MPLQATSGAASYDAFGSGVAAVPNYIEDVFSTYLYTGNGSTQTITNGIDLAGKGGLVWLKSRSLSAVHTLVDTARGAGKTLFTDLTNAQATNNAVSAFNSNGFTMGDYNNSSGDTYASWTFRKQPKFFDVVTYTGDGIAGRTVAHNLGSVPGCMIVKCTSTTGQWVVYHRVLGNTSRLYLNSTGGSGVDSGNWNNTDPTSTEFTLGNSSGVNASTRTYVAYLFAHNAGGFGLTGTDNVISCGSYTGNGSTNGPEINLGFEPQWILYKSATTADTWYIQDTMRQWSVLYNNNSSLLLQPNSSNAESGPFGNSTPTATGFKVIDSGSSVNASGQTYIYIAIRRGPMKVPTSGTSVFSPQLIGAPTGTNVTTGFPIDLQIYKNRDGGSNYTVDRLRGVSTSSTAINYPYLVTEATSAEVSTSTRTLNWRNTGFQIPSAENNITNIFWNFRRAPSFFDEVCYTGTGSATTFSHNLGVAPEMMIVKGRSGARAWTVYHSSLGATKYIEFDTSAAFVGSTRWNDTAPTSSVFTVGTAAGTNVSTETYVAYLFATCAGVSKVGSYTGTGTTLQVNCGFTGGARFVLIKRTDATGDWYVWDTARGIVAGNDPYLLLNSTAAEVTTTDYIDTYSAGFEISSTAPAAINASGGTFIFLAIA